MQQLRDDFKHEWLVTYAKIERARDIAKAFCVPLIGLLYLVDEPAFLCIRLANATGEFACPIRVERTETQATVNGGKALRDNAYIDVSQGTLFW